MDREIHKWDIEALKQLCKDIDSIVSSLRENTSLIATSSFELMQKWTGKSGAKLIWANTASAMEIEGLAQKLEGNREELTKLIDNCYQPCEDDIQNKVGGLYGVTHTNWRG